MPDSLARPSELFRSAIRAEATAQRPRRRLHAARVQILVAMQQLVVSTFRRIGGLGRSSAARPPLRLAARALTSAPASAVRLVAAPSLR